MSVKEWFNISEIAEILGCSRPTVYKKIDTIDKTILRSLQKRDKNITFYNYTLIDMFKDKNTQPTVDIPMDEVASDIDSNKYIDIYITELNNEIEFLKNHIIELSERLKQEQDLNKNNQILQLRQPQDLKALGEHFIELDNKLIDIKDRMQERKEEQEQKQKGFLSKLFNKQ